MLVKGAVEKFLVAARQAGKSDLTLRQYGWHLERMANWLAERGAEQLSEVSRALLRQWGAELRDQWSSATIKQAVCAAQAFFSWCLEERLVETEPGRGLKVPKVKDRIQRTLTADEVQALVDACDRQTAVGLRNLALVSLLVDSGLRASEICRLQLENVDLKSGLLMVVMKGGDEGLAYFGQTTARRLEAWLEVRVAADDVGTMFVSVGGITPGRPLTTSGRRNILRRLGEKVGVKGVSPHTFRRAFACISTEAGAPSRVVQAIGGWNDIRMVERYTKALRVKKLYRQYSPADFLENNRRDKRQAN